MATVMQETVDVLRQVQKLNKELNPVKTALLALKKREQATPNTEAAAASLDKVAARIESVCDKYAPSVARLTQLTSHELPQLFLQTPLLAAAQLDSTTATMATVAPTATTTALLDKVCPANLPYVVSADNYSCVRDALRMRVDVVSYLIATGRVSLARHVAQAYALPQLWFPQLWSPQATTTAAAAATAAATQGNNSSGNTPARAAVHNTTTTTKRKASTAVDKRMPALVARVVAAALFAKDEYMDRLVLQRLVQLRGYSAANEVDARADDDDGNNNNMTTTSVPSSLRAYGSTPQQLQQASSSTTTTAAAVDAAVSANDAAVRCAYVSELLARAGAVRHSHVCTQSSSPAFDAAMMTVVEHVLAHTLGVNDDDDTHKSSGADKQRDRGGKCTSSTTDAMMMHVQASNSSNNNSSARGRHRRGGNSNYNNSSNTYDSNAAATTTTTSAAGAVVKASSCSEPPRKQRTVERRVLLHDATTSSASAARATQQQERQQQQHMTRLPRRPRRRGLTPEELLLADDAWCSQVLFIKRPTRYYCMYSGVCMNDSGEVDDCPVALANGHVMSRRVINEHPLLAVLDGISNTPGNSNSGNSGNNNTADDAAAATTTMDAHTAALLKALASFHGSEVARMLQNAQHAPRRIFVT